MMRLPDRRGAIAAVSAVVAVAVIGFAGLAVDLTRIWMVNARLKTAIDAASLVAARQLALPEAERNAQVQAIYWANISQNGLNFNYMGATINDPTVTLIGTNRVQVTGSATVPTTLFSIINRQNTPISDSAIAERQGTGLELSLVLDVTGSMGVANIQALRTAARDLIDILYAGEERQPNLWVSVVPYTAVVNIGRNRESWLQPGSLNTANYQPTIWRGCVEARVGSNYGGAFDETETPPSTVRFRPHFWASNRYTYSAEVVNGNPTGSFWVRRGGNIIRTASPLATDVPVNRGDNPWIPGAGGNVVSNATANWSDAVWEPNPEAPGTDNEDAARGNEARGPNLGCPRAVLPLTRDRTPILAQIDALRHTHRGGTMANIGLQLGWGTLSPLWRADWALTEQREGQTLPLDYGTRAMTKAIVLMTDGENNWFDFPDGAPGRCNTTGNPPRCVTNNPAVATLPTVADWPWRTVGGGSAHITNDDADRTAYGRLSEERLGATISNNAQGTAEINARMARLCTAIRARGITIYTIVFDPNNNLPTSTQDLYRNCATDPREGFGYFRSPTREALNTAFRTIAGQLASLRLVQ